MFPGWLCWVTRVPQKLVRARGGWLLKRCYSRFSFSTFSQYLTLVWGSKINLIAEKWSWHDPLFICFSKKSWLCTVFLQPDCHFLKNTAFPFLAVWDLFWMDFVPVPWSCLLWEGGWVHKIIRCVPWESRGVGLRVEIAHDPLIF